MSHNETHIEMSKIRTVIQSNDNFALPLPPEKEKSEDMAVYGRFLRHLRCVPTSRMEIKILSAIQFTADMEGLHDAHVSKILVELGLRAPRLAFPQDFLKYADNAVLREDWEVGSASPALRSLARDWARQGEEQPAATRNFYALLEETALN